MSTTPHSGSDREIQQEIERTKSEAAHLASSAAETAKERGRDAADQAKERVAERADRFASALETTADDLESEGGSDALSGYGRSMAEMMRRFAGGLREHEIEEFAGQLAGFARRNPASFLAGSVALGFGVSRFLKSTSTRPLEEYGYDDDEDEYLLEEEDDFDFEEATATGYGAAAGEDAAPEANRTWPEDRGRERPGAGSASEHWSPSTSPSASPGSPGFSASSPGSGSSLSGSSVGEPGANRERNDDIGRTEP